jgi:hypothetical protein
LAFYSIGLEDINVKSLKSSSALKETSSCRQALMELLEFGIQKQEKILMSSKVT